MSWNQYRAHSLHLPELGLSLDWSRMNCPDSFVERMSKPMEEAFRAMAELEAGAVANPDERRQVGHYWLRTPELAPDPAAGEAIRQTVGRIRAFASAVHGGEMAGEGGAFTNLLLIGIGGSALGPQFVAQALGHPATDRMRLFFFDNTDPDGIDLVLSQLEGQLGRTLALVISKSGGTPETRNGMVEARQAWSAAGIPFARHAVAVTGEGSQLDRTAQSEGWLARFPMWDWVGGRTSQTGPVGLLPAALQGLDIDAFLEGARAMDAVTRVPEALRNPAAVLALMWYFATDGRGAKDMVILPYKDRLALFARYLQQLVMESLGKEKDLNGWEVHQGIAVYGNKGSTDQHAYIQQLREGIPNFFATFIEVLRDREGVSLEVEPGVTSGDYLQAFLLGTRAALHEKGRPSLSLTLDRVDPHRVGQLIALYERAVGLYASLVGINAYHQPGVEAGKKAASGILLLQAQILANLPQGDGDWVSASSLAARLERPADAETVFKILEHLAANPDRRVGKRAGPHPLEATYGRL